MKITGQILKTNREQRGLSVNEVAVATKINPKTILAIETGDSDNLPPKTFLRGFVLAYAAYLKIPQEEILNTFHEEMGSTRPSTEPEEVSKTTKSRLTGGRRETADYVAEGTSTTTKIGLGVGVVVLIFAILFIKKKMDAYESEVVVRNQNDIRVVDPLSPPGPPLDSNTPWPSPSPVPSVSQNSPAMPMTLPALSPVPVSGLKAVTNPVSPVVMSPILPAKVTPMPALIATPTAVPVAQINAPPVAQINAPPTAQPIAAPTAQTITVATAQQKSAPTITAPTAAPTPAPTPKATATPVPTPKPTPTPKLAATLTPAATPPAKAEAKSTPANAQTGAAPQATPATQASPSPSPAAKGKPQEVMIVALDTVTIEVAIDGEAAKKITMNADEVQTFKAKRKVVLKLDNGGAVNLVVNGKDRGVPGDLGKPKKVEFP